MRRLLGLSPSREVEIQFDGRRMIIEPANDPPVDASNHRAAAEPSQRRGHDEPLPLAMVIDAGRVASELCHTFHMTPERLELLFPGNRRIVRYMAWASHQADVENATPLERAGVRRLHICHQQLLEGRSWDEAIDIALRAEPLAA